MKIDASETGLPINTNNLQNGYISNMNKKYDWDNTTCLH